MTENQFCTVCEIEAQGDYCSACGQKIGKKPVTLLSMISGIISTFIDVEKSVFACLIYIVAQPKKIIDNYAKGYKSYYPSPGKFLIYSIAIAAIHIAYINPFVLGIAIDTDVVDAQVAFWLIVLPLMNVATYLTFLTNKVSFAKHLISNIYVGSSFLIFFIIIDDIIYLSTDAQIGSLLFPVFLLLVFVYNAIINSKNTGFFRVFLNAFISLAIFVGIVVVTLILLSLIFPELVSIN